MPSRILPLAVLLAAATLGGCGSDDGSASFLPNSDTGGGRGDGGDDSDAAVGDDTSGGPGADAGQSDDDTGGEEPLAVEGGITVYEVRAPDVDDLNVGGVAAGFQDLSAADDADVVATIGACTISSVAPDTDPFPDEPTLDAGAIDVSVGGETFSLAVEQTDDGPRYVAAVDDGRDEFFAEGASITFSAAGGADIPAFAGTVTAPGDPSVTAPAWAPFGAAHSRDADLTIEWGGASTGGDIIINILPIQVFPEPGIAEGNAITCIVPDSGNAVVPAAALAYLPESAGLGGGQSVALTVVRSVSRTVGLGDELLVNATASHTRIGTIE